MDDLDLNKLTPTQLTNVTPSSEIINQGQDLKLLLWALQHFPERVFVVNARAVLLDSGRPSGTGARPPYITLAVPDELVKGLKGRQERGDTVLVLRIPRELRERSESRIILPGEIRP